MKISIVIPTYNEEKGIKDCLESLLKQTYKDIEIIIVDDGSTDDTRNIVKSLIYSGSNLQLIEQQHLGPGLARNLGSESSTGQILVFVDADMTFDKKFIENLTRPIRSGKVIGTFSKQELVLNKDNVWSKCWNINKGLPTGKMHGLNYPNMQPIFRAILKKEFERAGGFRPIGYIDDYTISEKLGIQAIAAKGAIFYHRNPETLAEIYNQARWIGKSEYKKRKIKNENVMRLIAIIRYSFPFSLMKGILTSFKFRLLSFLIFKFVYDLAIEISLIKSFFGEQKYK